VLTTCRLLLLLLHLLTSSNIVLRVLLAEAATAAGAASAAGSGSARQVLATQFGMHLILKKMRLLLLVLCSLSLCVFATQRTAHHV
jgi:preprotein translocase subunit SecG